MMEAQRNVVYGVNGPVVTVRDTKSFFMQEMVLVGKEHLVGEVIRVTSKETLIQVYEETTGVRPGDPVEPAGVPLSVTLGPGLVGDILDGIERPLRAIAAKDGVFIGRGAQVGGLDTQKRWETHVIVSEGEELSGGSVFAEVRETESFLHRSMVPPELSGMVVWTAPDGEYTIEEPIIRLRDMNGEEHPVCLAQKWPIRQPRPFRERLPFTIPLITGQRVIDSVFPIAKGGTAAIPGGFGTGKTMTQHQLAKWCDADLIVYVGCGERGNEMTQVLDEFGELIDPRTGKKLTERTILIANTSNMPVAAREASIYTGITLAEYFRDMGYDVAMMADSTSRWAEALREISGRLEEMPAEEGFPAYLPSRLSAFYERAGSVTTLCGRRGSVTVIGAVSPQGSDFSEPVTQNTKRFTRVFWALDKSLAYARHYPSINWLDSYSEYEPDLAPYFNARIDPHFGEYRRRIVSLLLEESSLMEIVKLIGADVLPDDQRLIIDIARVIRVGFLQQNAYHPEDTYVPLEKQFHMMKTILHLYDASRTLIEKGKPASRVAESGLYEKLIRMKFDIPNTDLSGFDTLDAEIDQTVERLAAQ